MRKKYKSKKYKKNIRFNNKNHIDPMKSIMCTVLSVMFAIANSCFWIGIKGSFDWLIIIGGISTVLCIFLALFKCVKAYRGFHGLPHGKEF